ncbi:hypothetical protein EVAR_44106_1 [Eumeta japonica]|uniref:Uncharacterized protein n=1 Tax=Eumeta variegata TaxID=151549 RepID=A0A4C1X0K8_EUMVA|nr:hypothetical protein EVAR_44106_1 [Eumeta japonica]
MVRLDVSAASCSFARRQFSVKQFSAAIGCYVQFYESFRDPARPGERSPAQREGVVSRYAEPAKGVHVYNNIAGHGDFNNKSAVHCRRLLEYGGGACKLFSALVGNGRVNA